MDNSQVLQNFLIAVGYKIDDGGQRKFASTLAVQTEAVHSLADALKAVAGKILNFTRNTVDAMADLAFSSQKTRASASNILALKYAAEQTGASADDLTSSLQNIEEKARSLGDANYASFLAGFGVQATDANGKLLDTGQLLLNIKQRMADLTAQGLPQMAKILGDRNGLALGIQIAPNGEFQSRFGEDLDKQRKSGLNAEDAAAKAKQLIQTWASLKESFSLQGDRLGVAIGSKLLGPLTKLGDWVDSHGPQISKALGQMADALDPFIEATKEAGKWALKTFGGLLTWFNSLSPSTKSLIADIVLLAGGITATSAVVTILGSILGAIFAPGTLIFLGIAGLIALIVKFHTQIADFASLCWNTLKPSLEAIGEVFTGGLMAGFKNLKDMVELIGDLIIGRWSAAADKAKDVGKNLISYYSDVNDAVQAATNPGTTSTPASTGDDFHVSGNLAGVRGIRNNNPGNLNFVGQAGATRESGPGGRFAIFKTAQAGLNALAIQLRRYAASGINTIQAIINKYAPASDHNNTAAYIRSVAKSMNIGADQALNLGNSDTLAKMMDSIIRVENGGDPYSRQMLLAAAGNAGAAPINQTNNITVNGAKDPAATGREVEQALARANQQLVRNTRQKVS